MRLCGLRKSEVLSLLKEAALLVRSGFSIPVPPGGNLSPEGQLFTELCRSGCDDLLKSMNPNFEFPQKCWEENGWAEYVVYEQNGWDPAALQNETCPVNRTL